MLALFLVLLSALLLYSLWRLHGIRNVERAAEAVYASLRPVPAETGAAAADAEPPPDAADAAIAPERTPTMDFSQLIAVNPDVVGWLVCEGTEIDYPVVQGKDNEYYLTHLFDGTQNKSGTLFLDWRNAPDFSDDNSLVYGHHMKNGTMLAGIAKYKQQAYYDAHPVMMLYTRAGDWQIELFAGCVTTDEASYTARNFEDRAAFAAWLAECRARSAFVCAVTPDPEDDIITLVTCTYETGGAKFVLHGRLIPLP